MDFDGSDAMKTLYSMWLVIVKDLTSIEKDRDFSPKTRGDAKDLRIDLTGRRFLLLFNLMYDVVGELSLISLDMQKKSALLIDASSMTTKFRDIYTRMKTIHAKNVVQLLHEARCETEYEI